MGSFRRIGSAFLVMGTLLFSLAGCGDDNGSSVITVCEDCEHWTEILDGRASHPSYQPGGRNVIAFNSDRGNSQNIENIWVAELDDERNVNAYHQITSTEEDDFDPSWAPDGQRIAFTRAVGSGYELYLVRVDDFDNPGDEIRLTNTDVSDTAVIARPSASCWLDEETILFSDGQDIFAVILDGDDPTEVSKIINDPSDFIFSGTEDFVENQPAGIRVGGVDQIFFVSDSREPLGAIHVTAVDLEGDTVFAEVHLEGVPTDVLTPTVVSGRPALDEFGNQGQTYLVGASVTDPTATEDYCDTLLTAPAPVFENDTTDVEFIFDNPRGVIRLLAGPLNSNFFYDGAQQISIRADTTWIDCVYPSIPPDSVLHEVKIVSIAARDSMGNLLRDSVWVSVAAKETLEVVLDVSGQSEKGKGAGSGSYAMRPARKGARSASYVPQQWEAALWLYNGQTGDYSVFSDEGEFPSSPAVDPTGDFLVYVVDFTRLKLVSLVDYQVRWLPLPGATGVNVCYRQAAYPSWSDDGESLIISLTPCLDRPSTDNNAQEFGIWEIDVRPWLP